MRLTVTLIATIALMGLGSAASPDSRSPAASPTTIEVEMGEFRFRPAVIHLEAGRYTTLQFVNRGQLAHQVETVAFRRLPMTIVDPQSHIETSGLEILRLQPGAAATLRFTPRVRGRFRFACTIEGHQEAGMTGVLEVR